MPLDELRQLAGSLGARRGWDFSAIRDDMDPVPWRYTGIVRGYLSPLQRVLDIGTGGGEQFLRQAPHFGSGIGIDADPAMVAVAEENLAQSIACRVKFLAMDAAALEFPDASFDVVLNRHAPADVGEVARVLKPGGHFLTQQVGARNHANICSLFGCGPDGVYATAGRRTARAWRTAFDALGFAIRAWGEYDVAYYYRDIESLLFWLKALPVPEDFDIERHWPQVDQIRAAYGTARGIATNVHRELLIVQKPA